MGEFPNYSCQGGNKFAGLIGNLRTATIQVAQILRLYGYPQISYGVSDPLVSDGALYPNYFQLFQGDQIQYEMIVKLLKHYGWNWVGIITSQDESGERELQELSHMLTSHGICIELIIKMSVTMEGTHKYLAVIEKSTSQTMMSFNCSLSFAPSNSLIPGMETFLDNVRPSNRPSDPILQDICSDNHHKDGGCPRELRLGGCNKWKPNPSWSLRTNSRCLHDREVPPRTSEPNNPDSENCQTCPDNEWPDEKKVKCIPKTYDFLSYKDDIMVPVFFFISVFFLILSFFILGIFILYWDTTTVRANNRDLSFILLVSIILSFLCVFLFLGRPEDVTCMLRQTAFGVIFSVAVSCVLAKTIMVCIAFKATKPGSYWKKWMGAKVSNIIVLMSSSIQVFITIIWLAISPPFQELDMHSYNEKIIVQCNEGSAIAFYCVLGYMGLLAAVSFIIAFLARTLPDSFNEAKYITFSMLVFCSVWIAMIPAYLSTKGKYMVAVEIFAILASTAGLLSFMFFPKCYILLRKKEINRRHLLKQ
ncbi:vomeronasal type-2 receptor 26-like [Spea bombifrons]|uniref:vomeronasal type-2 receptor 26-like n=1 Tax=Spea bombifrons TaxID=233779 RepID=UPI002349DEBE|nr:vomeronasal type-2 receptor 26-like [Spea bombifrons]